MFEGFSRCKTFFIIGRRSIQTTCDLGFAARNIQSGQLECECTRSAVKLFNSMLSTNSVTLRRVVQADLNLQPHSSACWTAQLLSAFQGLCGRELYVRAVQTGRAILMQEFTADLKHRMRGVWRDAELVDPNTHKNKLATYHSWFATPFLEMSVCRLLYHSISALICPNMLYAK
jgi:hypothetical protein